MLLEYYGGAVIAVILGLGLMVVIQGVFREIGSSVENGLDANAQNQIISNGYAGYMESPIPQVKANGTASYTTGVTYEAEDLLSITESASAGCLYQITRVKYMQGNADTACTLSSDGQTIRFRRVGDYQIFVHCSLPSGRVRDVVFHMAVNGG